MSIWRIECHTNAQCPLNLGRVSTGQTHFGIYSQSYQIQNITFSFEQAFKFRKEDS